MLSKTGRFGRADRVLCSREFGRAVKSGKRGTSKNFVVVIAPRVDGVATKYDESRTRLGVTVGKRVGNSVIRNGIKRRIREWFRHARRELPRGSDIVVIARRAARELTGSEFAPALDEVICGARTRRGDRKTAECR